MKGPTAGYVLNQTMLRIKDPERSIPFFRDVMGMTLLDCFDFPEMRFSLYFLGYANGPVPDGSAARVQWIFQQSALLELTHNWGTEDEAEFHYHHGNEEPRGYGHIGISVPDVELACQRFEELGVEFVKRPAEGKMKGIAFVKDPDGYWIEILSSKAIVDIVADLDG